MSFLSFSKQIGYLYAGQGWVWEIKMIVCYYKKYIVFGVFLEVENLCESICLNVFDILGNSGYFVQKTLLVFMIFYVVLCKRKLRFIKFKIQN